MTAPGGSKARNGFDKRPREESSAIGGWISDMFKRGRLHAGDVLDGARAESDSNVQASDEVRRLANHKTKHNGFRDVMRPLKAAATLPDVYYVDAPLWDTHKNCTVNGSMGSLHIRIYSYPLTTHYT